MTCWQQCQLHLGNNSKHAAYAAQSGDLQHVISIATLFPSNTLTATNLSSGSAYVVHATCNETSTCRAAQQSLVLHFLARGPDPSSNPSGGYQAMHRLHPQLPPPRHAPSQLEYMTLQVLPVKLHIHMVMHETAATHAGRHKMAHSIASHSASSEPNQRNWIDQPTQFDIVRMPGHGTTGHGTTACVARWMVFIVMMSLEAVAICRACVH